MADDALKDTEARAFASLFRDAHRKCFSSALTSPLTESESHHFSVEISESTGLEIGWKSLKNYSHFVLGQSRAKPENPSTPTLDTLARYVAGAPRITQEERRIAGRHYPYWFRYKESFRTVTGDGETSAPDIGAPDTVPRTWSVARAAVAGGIATVAVLVGIMATRGTGESLFADDFDIVTDRALVQRGWFVLSIDSTHWARRNERPGHLTLYTLRGDNWPHAGVVPRIRNLLMRETRSRCLAAELHLTDFFPTENWQQAGLLLYEDTSFAGKSLRMSIGYNDYAGGFPETREIIIQAITLLGGEFSNPEEIAHQRLFVVESGTEELVRANLAHAALRIEKEGTRLRLLYAVGPIENAAFREVVSTEFDMNAAYVGIFAIKGLVDDVDDVPVYVDAFSSTDGPC